MFRLLQSIPSGAEALIQEVQQHITKIGLDVVNSLRGDNVSLKKFFFFCYLSTKNFSSDKICMINIFFSENFFLT